MKKLLLIFVLAALWSCSDDTYTEEVLIATPVTTPIAEFRSSVGPGPVQQISESGKIYAYQEYVLVNDKYKGIHIIDNSDPANPAKIGFINVPGNVDMAVKNDILYVDSWLDLYVFDFTDPANPTLINRLEEVLPKRTPDFEGNIWEVNYNEFDPDSEVIVGWEYRTELRQFERNDDFVLESANDSGGGTGTGGSLARFNITGDYLYVVDSFRIFSFDISNLDNPQLRGETSVGAGVETIFSDGDYLYIGSPIGMFIYGLSNPGDPLYLSQVTHITGCDPVVVQDDIAYVTVRGGNWCGQPDSLLDVVDVTDRSNPFILKSETMNEPYGLGVKGDRLYVSDGSFGLAVYDISDPLEASRIITYNDLEIFDVIPMEQWIIMIGNNTLYNYEYTDEGIGLIASFSLN
ncbi:LVIVD repeat-containing protein [Gilvibacter sp.]|uniref:LVIVD repeat-containing protein n=1 Tax=Gilvibacter sp. TaxID=2729997 RepID=UPI003F4A61FB